MTKNSNKMLCHKSSLNNTEITITLFGCRQQYALELLPQQAYVCRKVVSRGPKFQLSSLSPKFFLRLFLNQVPVSQVLGSIADFVETILEHSAYVLLLSQYAVDRFKC